MPDNILRVGTEFDVGPLVAGSAAAGASFDELLTKIADTAVEAKQLAQDQEALGISAVQAAESEDAESGALLRVAVSANEAAVAHQNLGGASAVARTGIGLVEGSAGMAASGLARMAASSQLIAPLLQAAFAPIAALALITVLDQLYDKFGEVANQVTGYTKAVQDAEKADIKFSDAALGHATSLADAQQKIHAIVAEQGDIAQQSYGSKFAGALEKAEEQTSSWWGPLRGVVTTVTALGDAESQTADYSVKLADAQRQLTAEAEKYTIETAKQVEALGAERLEASKAGLEGPSGRVTQIQLEIAALKEKQGLDQQIAGDEAVKAGADPGTARILAQQADIYKLTGLTKELALAQREAATYATDSAIEMARVWERTQGILTTAAEKAKALADEEQEMFTREATRDSGKSSTAAFELAQAQVKGAEQSAKAQEDLQVSAIEFKKTEASEALRIEEGIIAASGATARQKAEMLRQAEVGELEQLKSIEAQKLAVILASLSAQQAALGSDVADMAAGKRVPKDAGEEEKKNQYLKIQQDIDAARQESVQKDAGYNLQIVAANQHAADQVRDAWQKSMQKVESAFQSNFDQVVRGTETVKFAFIKMGGDIVIAMLHSLEQMLFQVVSHELAMVAAHAAGAQAQVATSASAASETKAIEGSLAISSIAKSAVKAASAAYAAVSEIPVVGPILAPIAAAGAFAGVMAFGVLVGAAKQGALLSEDSIIAAGAGEMVLPRPISEGLQGAVPALGRFNEAFGGRGGLAPAFAGGGGDGGGGSSSTSNVTHNNFSVQTLDVGTMEDFLNRNQRAISGQIKGAVRERTQIQMMFHTEHLGVMQMKRLLLFLVMVLFAAAAHAQTRVVVATAPAIANLPSASANANSIFFVIDGVSATDCTVGGGSTTLICKSNGSAWIAVNTGGGTPGGSNTQVQVNTAGAFAGIPCLSYSSSTLTNSCAETDSGTKTSTAMQNVGTGGIIESTGGQILATNTNLAIPTAGLMGEYRILSTESACGILDYSGNGRNATGCVGTSPTIIANSGGLNFTADGAVSLPSALNSARTIIVIVNMQGTAQANAYTAPLIGNGNGAASNANGLMLGPVQSAGGLVLGAESVGGSAQKNGGNAIANGLFAYSLAMGSSGDSTNDALYMNTAAIVPESAAFQSAGLQTTGNYQLGGTVNGSGFNTIDAGTYIRGQIYYAAFYSTYLSPSQISTVVGAMQAILNQRGLGQFALFSTLSSNSLLCEGDSITNGNGSTPFCGVMTLNQTWATANHGLGGDTVALMTQAATVGQIAEPFFSVNQQATAMTQWGGSNDCAIGTAASTILGYNITLGRYVRRIGMRNFPMSMLSRTGAGNDTCKNALNTGLRAQWIQFGDAFFDVGATALGADGAYSNTALFVDGTHPTQAAHWNIITPLVQRGINRYYACQDFSCATTYTSGAPAGTLDTAESETGNTMTFTSTLNPGVGNTVACTGGTVTGYNSPAWGWYVLTSGSSSFTAYNNTTGLGNGTVTHSTCSVPLQKDADVYVILGGSGVAPNFTLETSIGYTGGKVFLKGADTNAWTVTPWDSETVDGGSTTTVTLGQVLCLESVLVSSSAAGSNWMVCQ